MVTTEDLRATIGYSGVFASYPRKYCIGGGHGDRWRSEEFSVGDVVLASASEEMGLWCTHATFSSDSSMLLKAPMTSLCY